MTDDEALLAAYLDGELTEAEAAAFEARLAAEPDLIAKAGDWRAVDDTIAKGLAPLAEEPISEDMLRRLGLAPSQLRPPAEPAPQPIPAPAAANDNPWLRRWALPFGAAAAAGLAAVLLVSPHETADPARDLSFALETSRSGTTVRLADGADITPTLTVQAADGRYCREYRAGPAIALACRAPDGRWNVAATGAGAGPEAARGIAVAGGASGASLDAAYRKIGASDPLDAAAEDRLLRSGWSPR